MSEPDIKRLCVCLYETAIFLIETHQALPREPAEGWGLTRVVPEAKEFGELLSHAALKLNEAGNAVKALEQCMARLEGLPPAPPGV